MFVTKSYGRQPSRTIRSACYGYLVKAKRGAVSKEHGDTLEGGNQRPLKFVCESNVENAPTNFMDGKVRSRPVNCINASNRVA